MSKEIVIPTDDEEDILLRLTAQQALLLMRIHGRLSRREVEHKLQEGGWHDIADDAANFSERLYNALYGELKPGR